MDTAQLMRPAPDGPEIRLSVERGCVHALVVRRVVADVPLLLDVQFLQQKTLGIRPILG